MYRRLLRAAISLTAVAALSSVADAAIGQGGQGGFGGGGALTADAREGDPVSFQHILTPGDSGEWPITARAGETVIVFVASNSFDPAAQIVDAAGKVLAENDDVRPGDQNSLILYRFANAGDYKILVKGFKSAAGGQYTLRLQRFMAIDLRKGERNAATLGRTGARWHRFSADQFETLVISVQSATFAPQVEVYMPTGQIVSLYERQHGSPGHARNAILQAPLKGDYYLQVIGRENAGYVATIATARVAPLAIGVASAARRLDAGGLDLWTFPGKAGDVLRVRAAGAGPSPTVSVWRRQSADKPEEQTDSAVGGEPVIPLPVGAKRTGEMVVMLNRTGTHQIEVSQSQGLPTDYTITVTPASRPWTAGRDPAAALPVGGSDFWALDGKAGEVVKLEGLAEAFDIELELFNPRGDSVDRNDDGAGGHNALITALLKDTGRYLLRVHAYGDGGGGTYKLVRRPDPVRMVKIGGRVEAVVGAGASDVWSFEGRSGQTLILSVRSHDFNTRAIVYGPDAIEIANDEMGHDGTDSLISVRLPLNGLYTIWISSRDAGGKYVLKLVDAE
ncbi:MAG TPA: hypothetical protein VKT77_04105 [Chthonomonadaceae bacterium]|nr:hypothetical protein [Chthonomonadaceae bacterium]